MAAATPTKYSSLPTVEARADQLLAHQSQSQRWKWHLQDFVIAKYVKVSESNLEVIFTAKWPLLVGGMLKLSAKDSYPVTAVSSIRLAFISSIMAAGVLSGRQSKDGEVIARQIDLKCKKPLLYDQGSEIPVKVKIEFLKKKANYQLFLSEFQIGSNAEHSGKTTLLYCEPDTKDFSYL